MNVNNIKFDKASSNVHTSFIYIYIYPLGVVAAKRIIMSLIYLVVYKMYFFLN